MEDSLGDTRAAHMALPNSPGSPGAGKPNPGVIDLGTIFVDSDIIFGFTSHLLKRKTRVRVSRNTCFFKKKIKNKYKSYLICHIKINVNWC